MSGVPTALVEEVAAALAAYGEHPPAERVELALEGLLFGADGPIG